MNSIHQNSLKSHHELYDENKVFVDVLHNYVLENFPEKYGFKTKKQKYDAKTIIIELLYITITGLSYKNYRGPVNAKTLNRHVIFFAQHMIFEKVYYIMHKKYLDCCPLSKLKLSSIDTSYIMNKNGKENLGRNTHFKNKNCYKVSIIVDSNGIPYSTVIVSGNQSDVKIAKINIDEIKEYTNELIDGPFMLADKMYDSKKFRQECIKKGYTPIIDYNKRNTKNIKLIKKLTKKEKSVYKKRIKVENTFCIMKKYRRIQLIYDSYFITYKSFLYLAECCMIQDYIKKPKISNNKVSLNALKINY